MWMDENDDKKKKKRVDFSAIRSGYTSTYWGVLMATFFWTRFFIFIFEKWWFFNISWRAEGGITGAAKMKSNYLSTLVSGVSSFSIDAQLFVRPWTRFFENCCGICEGEPSNERQTWTAQSIHPNTNISRFTRREYPMRSIHDVTTNSNHVHQIGRYYCRRTFLLPNA